ncbi:MAG: phosphatase PAP2 family protein, partial [Acidobacteriota bacterium]
MPAALVESTFHRISQLELPVCRFCHRWSTARIARFFGGVSRIGDGHYFYLVLGAVLLVQGQAALPLLGHIAAAGAVCHVLYRALKRSTARQRPFDFAAEGFDLSVPPLDKYSFPSGHTMHAVFFTLVMGAYVPMLLWILVPFAVLVAASRIVLGLHYPTDVAAGAILGALLA